MVNSLLAGGHRRFGVDSGTGRRWRGEVGFLLVVEFFDAAEDQVWFAVFYFFDVNREVGAWGEFTAQHGFG